MNPFCNLTANFVNRKNLPVGSTEKNIFGIFVQNNSEANELFAEKCIFIILSS